MSAEAFKQLFSRGAARRLTPSWHLWNLFFACVPAGLIALMLEPKRRELERAKAVRSTAAPKRDDARRSRSWELPPAPAARWDMQAKLAAKQQAAQKAAAPEPAATVETRLTALAQTVQEQLVRASCTTTLPVCQANRRCVGS